MSIAHDLTGSQIWDILDLSPIVGADLESYLDLALAKCVEWFRASGGTVFLESEPGEFVLRSRYRQTIELPEAAVIRAGQGIGGIVVESGIGRIIDDPSRDPELAGVKSNEAIVSSMVLPLIDTRGKTIGLLNISRKVGELPFRSKDLGQAMALASHLALAVTNATMVSQLQEKVEQAQVANEKLSGVLDSVAGAVVVVDSTGEVVNHNHAAAKVNFLAQDDKVDLDELQTKLLESTKEVLASGKAVSNQAYDKLSDRTWLVEALPLMSGGAVITVSEITEHERQQRELGRVKRLAEIGQMTAAIAHEIRNPLTGIRSAAQMIREHPDTLPDFIGLIEEEALKLNSLCDEFLEFARPMQLSHNETSLWEVVEPVLTLMRPSFEKKGVELLGRATDDQPTIMVDGRRISQVVLNLLRNALQATEAGKRVLVDVSSVRVIVEDEGCGIDPESLEKLFSPFFTTKPDGTGLGLCNSRKIVDAHGGELLVESKVGQGTKFEIVFDRNLA